MESLKLAEHRGKTNASNNLLECQAQSHGPAMVECKHFMTQHAMQYGVKVTVFAKVKHEDEN
jgi:hypothetical protein